ncbi:protein kinase domain-containing protein [Vibrio tetraodonis]|uniref:protein kinase domain-containing protein n=1 Tax=Vibrio tetraodonis TaxID=2231647 RepID=UPI000E0C8D75|nr:protein kinase [Vibrio tetraodonis]
MLLINSLIKAEYAHSISRVEGNSEFGSSVRGVRHIPNTNMPLSNIFGGKPEISLPLGWKGEPPFGAPNIEGMESVETDKFAEGESHISIMQTQDGQRLVAKIERSVAEGHLLQELEAYQHIYDAVGKHPNLGNVYGMAIVPYGSRKEEALLMDEVDGRRGSETFMILANNFKKGKISSEEYWGTIKFIALRLLDVTAHLSKAGISHNDIKPDNIVFDNKTGEPIVIDLGLHSRFGEEVKGFTDSFKAPELRACSTSASEKSDVFLVASTLLNGIEEFELSSERKPNQAGFAGIKTAYTRFFNTTLNLDPHLRADATSAKQHEFLTDGIIDENAAKQVLTDSLAEQTVLTSNRKSPLKEKNLQDACSTLREHLSTISTNRIQHNTVFSDLVTFSTLRNKAESQGLSSSGKFRSLDNLITKTNKVVVDYVKRNLVNAGTNSGELSIKFQNGIVTKSTQSFLVNIERGLQTPSSFADIRSLEREQQLVETMFTVLLASTEKDKAPIRAEVYSLLNQLAEVKKALSSRVGTLKVDQANAASSVVSLLDTSQEWFTQAKKALENFDKVTPRVKFGANESVQAHQQMVSAHATLALQEVSKSIGKIKQFAHDARPLLIALGERPLADQSLTFQRERLREVATVAERLSRLEFEWV